MSARAQPEQRQDDPRPSVRVYGLLRTAHLERLRDMEPAEAWFTGTRYDYDASLEDESHRPQRMTRRGAVLALARRSYRVVEVNEPANVRRWVDVFLQIAAVRFRWLMTRQPELIVTYCIGIADPADEVAKRLRVPRPIARALTWVVMNVLVRGLDRLAFGTQGSMDMYATYVRRKRLERVSALIEALPAPCSCGPPDSARDDGRLLFLGAFDEHKGIRQLMAAWDVLAPGAPVRRLRLIGKGPLVDEVTAWAADRPDVMLLIDPPRSVIHEELWQSAVLILLSQRTPTFREQVGLPIVEGLSHGCRIVTSSETGIAAWLASHGHVVTNPAADPTTHAAAIVQAFETPRSAEEVLADLPRTDGRLEADRWLFAALS